MKIILKQIHQTGEVHHTLAGQLTRTLDVLGRASALHIAAKKLILRSLVRVSLLTSCTIPRTGLDKQVERVARKTSEQVTVCVLSTRMSCVFNPERTRQRGLLPLRGETWQKEEFLYKCFLLYSIGFSGRLDVYTFHFIRLLACATHSRAILDSYASNAICASILLSTDSCFSVISSSLWRNFETCVREMWQNDRSHTENAFECLVCDARVYWAGSTRHAFKRDRGLLREGCAKCFYTSKFTEDISCKTVWK